MVLTIWLHPVPWSLPHVWLSNNNQLFALLFQHHMSNCKGNNNDGKNLLLELHVYVFELFLTFIEIFKIWNCNTHLLSRTSVAPNYLKSTEFSFQDLMVWFWWQYPQFLLIPDYCWIQISILCPSVHFYKLILQIYVLKF